MNGFKNVLEGHLTLKKGIFFIQKMGNTFAQILKHFKWVAFAKSTEFYCLKLIW